MSYLKLPDWFNEEYKEVLKKQLRSDTSSIDEFISYIGSPELVPTWTIKGRLFWGDVHLEIRDFVIEDLIHHNVFGMNFVSGSKAAFSFMDESTSIGVS